MQMKIYLAKLTYNPIFAILFTEINLVKNDIHFNMQTYGSEMIFLCDAMRPSFWLML